MPHVRRGTYSTLTASQRATYEAVIHALDHHRLLGIVDAVTAIWGRGRPNSFGTDQFRLSVVLSRNAQIQLWDKGFEFSGRGHVKRSSGSSENRYTTDNAREPGRLPKLQVSWLREDPRIGEIDIDYRSLRRLAHLDPANSDVRESSGENPHFCLHIAKYGERLVDWWNDEPEECNRSVANSSVPLSPPGWVELGLENTPEEWAIDVPNTETLDVGRRMVVTKFREMFFRIRSGGSRPPVVGRVYRGTCVRLLADHERMGGGVLWVRIQRVNCDR